LPFVCLDLATAIEGAVEVRVPALGEAASQLPWLSPCAASLLALARSQSAETWDLVRNDPGAVLLVVRQTARTLASVRPSFSWGVLQDPGILDGAVRLLGKTSGRRSRDTPANGLAAGADLTPSTVHFVDWNQPSVQPVYRASLAYARMAHDIAARSGRCHPEAGWVAGLLAPLGWLAACAIDSDAVAHCLADPALAQNPIAVQQRWWGNDQAGIARRLIRHWRLPRWLAVVVGHLGLPLEIAQGLDADADLFRVVQLAVSLVQQQGRGLHLMVGAEAADHISALGISCQDREALVRDLDRPAELPGPAQGWQAPQSVPLLNDLLHLAAENQRLLSAPALEQLERDQDLLHQALEKQRTGEAQRLRELKLQALAEFAGGAAHEINNPLAVISGQAQYLLAHDEDPARQRALQAIIGQAQRIHQVLNELMQFARPAKPKKQVVDVRILLREVMLALGDLALHKHIQLSCADPDQAIHLNVDPDQARTALHCLLRNAIEAAPSGGWAKVSVQTPGPDRLELIVEDNGAGPNPTYHDQLFDPFYSGRQAGRGRGLGLPTAWRLAREQEGEVRFDDVAGGPTRFILSLPRETEANGPAPGPANYRKDAANGVALPLPSDS
jgi:two-component system NtrC family sensor kinase